MKFYPEAFIFPQQQFDALVCVFLVSLQRLFELHILFKSVFFIEDRPLQVAVTQLVVY